MMMNGPMLTNGSTTTASNNNNNNNDSKRTYTLYLLRHGEAAHNIQEKVAIQRALKAAVSDGLQADSSEAVGRMEEARQAVLQDQSFFDAPLSDKGKKEAAAARTLIQELTCYNGNRTADATPTPATCCWLPPPTKVLARPLFTATTSSSSICWLPPPTEVLVSPLQRTLQTADLVFPDHLNIRVRDELRERLTGRPADNRMASTLAEQQFRRFDFVHLRLNSFVHLRPVLNHPFVKIKSMMPFMQHSGGVEKCEHVDCAKVDDDDNDCDGYNDDGDDGDTKEESTKQAPKHPSVLDSSFNAHQVQEDEDKLRRRTMKLFELLAHSQHDSVAIVTHKGFLRALERGALGQPDATEFEDCELRVYRVTLSRGSKVLDDGERLR
jgi:broad specificity phosphatase PhoE